MEAKGTLCDHRHDLLNKEIDEIKTSQKEHEKRISYLERMSAVREEQIINLVKSIDNLVIWIKWILGIATTTLLGLLVWFFQNSIS